MQGSYSLELTDLRGKCVIAAKGKISGLTNISMSAIPSGVYIVKMTLFDSGGAPAGGIEVRRALTP
jgi:hypothetical protein